MTVDDLPEKIRQHQSGALLIQAESAADVLKLDELARRYAVRALALVGGNKSKAAELLGVDRRTLYRRLDRYERPR